MSLCFSILIAEQLSPFFSFTQNTVVMGIQHNSVYQQVIERTRALSFRSSLLASNIEKRETELANRRAGAEAAANALANPSSNNSNNNKKLDQGKRTGGPGAGGRGGKRGGGVGGRGGRGGKRPQGERLIGKGPLVA
jgi:hypothetical protein